MIDATSVEPRYLQRLEAERSAWWNARNFEQWKQLYASEYARGFQLLDTLQRHVPGFSAHGLRVLDVGCGDAGLPIAFAERGAHAAGIEPDRAALERGTLRVQEHGVDVELRQGSAEQLPWPDGSFQLVVLDNVLEHVHDRVRTLTEAARVLQPGGLLYLVTPKPFAAMSILSDPHYQLAGLTLMPRLLQVWYFERVRGGGRGNYGVGVIPTRRGVRRLLRAAGFRVLADPRQLWLDYLRHRIADADGVSRGRRRAARWLHRQHWAFANPLTRALLDMALGSNIFIARRA